MAEYRSKFIVDGTPLEGKLCPSSFSVTYQDLDGEGTERNANGILVRQIIRRNVIKIEIQFAPMTTEEANTIINLFNKEQFQFTYPDPLYSTNRTITAYCGDRNVNLKFVDYELRKLPTGDVRYYDIYEGLSFSIIEY